MGIPVWIHFIQPVPVVRIKDQDHDVKAVVG
jgi:hypothetical protein